MIRRLLAASVLALNVPCMAAAQTGGADTSRRNALQFERFGNGGPFVVICVVATLPCSVEVQTALTVTPAGAQEQAWPPAGVVQMCRCDRDPTVLKSKHPSYTKKAMAARVQGTMSVEAVVETNGVVGDVRVVRSLDKEHGLDDAAVKAMKQWKFKPGRAENGDTARVLVEVEFSFWLHQ